MKKTDLEKNKGLKLESRLRQSTLPGRFGQQAHAVPDRRAQRKLDQERGLVPFAVKLDSALVQQMRDLADKREMELSELVGELLRIGIAQGTSNP